MKLRKFEENLRKFFKNIENIFYLSFGKMFKECWRRDFSKISEINQDLEW